MDEYRRRLERTTLPICAFLVILLFGGVLALPRTGQVIWIAVVFATYIRLILVITRREEELEESPTHENKRGSAWYAASGSPRTISETRNTPAVRHEPAFGRRPKEIARYKK
jgi:hypothetical protein